MANDSPQGDSERQENTANRPPDERPVIEDAAASEPGSDANIGEDAPEFLSEHASFAEADAKSADDSASDEAALSAALDSYESDEFGDTDSIKEEPATEKEMSAAIERLDLAQETSAHRLAVELKRVERSVRAILDLNDARRKRKLTGTRRWNELEEDLVAWQFSGRFDQPTLGELRRLVTRRHYLLKRLRFLAGTRPTWNS